MRWGNPGEADRRAVSRPAGGRDPAAAVGHVIACLGRVSPAHIVAVTVAVRLLAALAIPAETTETYEFGHVARSIVAGDGFSYYPATAGEVLAPGEAGGAERRLPSAHMPPLYAYVTAGAMEIAGPSHVATVWAVRVFNLVMAAATALGLLMLSRRLLGSGRGATLAALAFALYPTGIYMATQVSAANLYVPVTIAVILLLLGAVRARAPGVWVAAGLATGVLCLLRAEALLMVPLVTAWLVCMSAVPSGRRRYRLAALFLVTAVAIPGAWILRSSLAFGRPVFTVTTTGGSNLWIGNHTGASGSQKEFSVPPELRARLDELPPSQDYEVRKDALWRREALAEMAGDPLGTAARDLKKLAMLLTVDVHDDRSFHPAYMATWAALAVTGTAGLRRWWRRGDPAGRYLVAGYLAFSIVIPVVFFVLPRYKLPLEIMLLVFAGGWVARHGRGGAAAGDRGAIVSDGLPSE